MLGYLSDGNYDGMVRGHMLRDCSVTTADIANARAIYARQSPLPAVSNYVDVPRLIRDRCRDIDISADLFFINKVAFFVTRSRRLQFGTAIATTATTKPHLVGDLSRVGKLYLYISVLGFGCKHALPMASLTACTVGTIGSLFVASHDKMP